MTEARTTDLGALVAAVRRGLAAPARLYLVAATSHLAEGWRDRAPRLELAGDPQLETPVRHAAATLDLDLVWESPADVIPLPADWEARERAVTRALTGPDGHAPLIVRHFDPYSVVLRLVARGDEPDYVIALEYMRHGWVELARLEALLDDLLPRFTRATLAQDPAEFRRKFRGLRQLTLATALTGAAAKAILAPPPNAEAEAAWISSPTS